MTSQPIPSPHQLPVGSKYCADPDCAHCKEARAAFASRFRATRTSKILAYAALVSNFLFAAFLGVLWLDHKRHTSLPTPGGTYPIGFTSFVWTDAHEDPLAPPHTQRELFVWMWYPATPSTNLPLADYLPASWRRAVEREMGFLPTNFLTRDLSRVHLHGVRDAEVAAKHPMYPVVLMRGGHSALTADYTSFAEDLASHGYFVVGFDAPYRTFVTVRSNGQVIKRLPQNNAEQVSGEEQRRVAERLVQDWSGDMSFVLDRLEELNTTSDSSGRFRGRLNLQRVGAFGHSLGGAEALQFCHDDIRCQAGVDVDGAPVGTVIADGVKQPFLFLLSDHSREPAAETNPVKANIHSVYDRLPSDDRLQVVVQGANHYNFSDGGVLKAPLLMRVLHRLGIIRLEGRRQIVVSAHYVTTFFDVHLRGLPPSRLQDRPDFPEARSVN